jgi:hypothetical protein
MDMLKNYLEDIHGRVAPPLLLYFLGVPGGICLLLWLFVWRGN